MIKVKAAIEECIINDPSESSAIMLSDNSELTEIIPSKSDQMMLKFVDKSLSKSFTLIALTTDMPDKLLKKHAAQIKNL